MAPFSSGVPVTLLLKRDAEGNYEVDDVLEDNQELKNTIDGKI